jgi:hypothetical protein
MSLRNQFVDIAEPAPKPVIRAPVTAALAAKIDRVEPVVATNAPAATNEVATYAKPVATNSDKPVRTANRREPEAYRAYQRTYMAKRRAAEKVTGPEDRASLAIADSPA